MSALEKARESAHDPRHEVLKNALLRLTPKKRDMLLFIDNNDIVRALDSANSAVTCVGCRSAVKTRLVSGMEEDENPLMKATFEWGTAPGKQCNPAAPSSFKLRADYLRNPGRVATLVTRFPTSTWVAQADAGNHGQDADQLNHLRRRRKKQKGSQRCQHHASKRNGISPGLQWEQAWERMTPEQRQDVVTVPGAELEKALEMHLAIHKFCPSCADNVRAVFDLLMGCEPNDEVAAALGIASTIEDEEAAVAFANPLLSIDTDRCSNGTVGPLPTVCFDPDHVSVIIHHAMLMLAPKSRDNGETREVGRERHATSLSDTQEELKAALGRTLKHRIESAWAKCAAEEHESGLVFRLALDALRMKVEQAAYEQQSDELLDWMDDNTAGGTAANNNNGGGGAGAKKRNKKKKKKKKKGAKDEQAAAAPAAAPAPAPAATSTAVDSADDDDAPSLPSSHVDAATKQHHPEHGAEAEAKADPHDTDHSHTKKKAGNIGNNSKSKNNGKNKENTNKAKAKAAQRGAKARNGHGVHGGNNGHDATPKKQQQVSALKAAMATPSPSQGAPGFSPGGSAEQDDLAAQAEMMGISVADLLSLQAQMAAKKQTIAAKRQQLQNDWEKQVRGSGS